MTASSGADQPLIVAIGVLVLLLLCAWAWGTDYYNRKR